MNTEPIVRKKPLHLIGCNISPHVTPGGFSKTRATREQTRASNGSGGCMDVANAAAKWLNDRNAR